MSSIGEIISELCTSSPLLSGGTWTSNQIQLGQWNSLSVIVYCDTNCTFTSHWSASGIYYDYTETYNITANTPIQFSIVTLDKWMYFTLINFGTNQTVLRFNTYGTVTNNAVQVKFPNSVTVNVANQQLDLGGNPYMVKLNPFQDAQINLRNVEQITKSLFSAEPNLDVAIKPTMKYEVTDSAISYFATDSNMISLKGFVVSSAADVDKFARFYSNSVTPIVIDKTMVVSITTLFNDTDQSSNYYYSDEQVGFGLTTDSSSTTWYTGFSIGKGEPALWGSTYTKFRIRRWNNGTATTVTQNNFNLDVLNGTGLSGMVLDTTKLNNYLIKFKVGGTTQAVFSVLNPSTGKYVDFHSVTNANTQTTPGYNLGCRLIIESVNKSEIATVGDVAGSSTSSFATYIESGNTIKPGYPISFGTNCDIATSETHIALLYNNEAFHSNRSSIPLVISDLSFSSDSSASTLTIRLYKNTTITSASFSDVNEFYSPLQYTTATFTVGDKGVIVGTYSVGPHGWFTQKPKGIILNPGENLMIVGQLNTGSASNVNCAITFLQYI